MTNTSAEARPRAQLFLGDRPRLLIPLAAGPLPAWLAVSLPGPDSVERPAGRFLADPRLPESEVVLEWGEAAAVPRALTVLTITAGDQSWTLEQDIHHPERWVQIADRDRRRHWS